MSRTELSRLLEDAQRQPSLLEDLRRRLADPQAALRWAAEMGYHLGREEIAELAGGDRELSDEELEEAAGGDWAPTPPPPSTTTGGGSGG